MRRSKGIGLNDRNFVLMQEQVSKAVNIVESAKIRSCFVSVERYVYICVCEREGPTRSYEWFEYDFDQAESNQAHPNQKT